MVLVEDFLENDDPIPGQKYGCITFVSPDSMVEKRELFYMEEFFKKNCSEMGLNEDLREIKKNKEFSSTREEILSMIWNMEEEIMGKEN